VRELQHALRALWRRRTTTVVAILCLALGIGANTALFGILDALLYQSPVGVAAPEQLMRINSGPQSANPRRTPQAVTYPAYLNAREDLAAMVSVAAYAPRRVTLDGGERAELLEAVIGSDNYFSVLGVNPIAGRFFDGADEGLAVVVLSHFAWQHRFGGARNAIGSVIDINGVSVSIIGVAPPAFVGVDLGSPDVWLPIWLARLDAFGGMRQHSERVYWLQMFGRSTGGTNAFAFATSTDDRGGEGWNPPAGDSYLHATPLRPVFFAEQAGSNPVPLWSLGITVLVLVLACATVANMLLAQGATREQDIAVRLALGAPRTLIVRQLMLEAVLIAMAAAVCALAIAEWGRHILTNTLPVPSIQQLVNGRVAAFAFMVALFTTSLFGLLPAVWSARGSLDAVLRRTSGGSRRARPQVVLMSTQIALSFVLLVGAALFIASVRNARDAKLGFDMEYVLTASFELGHLSASDAANILEHATPRIGALPGVGAVGRGRLKPFLFFGRTAFTVQGDRRQTEPPITVLINSVDVDYFASLGITASSGRLLEENDRASTAPVVVVSEAVAKRYWPGESPVGSCVQFLSVDEACVRVVGVARDVRFERIWGDPSEIVYVPASQGVGDPPTTLFVRTSNPSALAESVRRVIQEVDDKVPFVRVAPLDTWARPQRINWEVAATLFSLFGVLATLLAAVGLYMLVSFVVSQRRRELAIRMALGATGLDIGRLVVVRSLRVAGWGIAAGAVGAFLLGRVLANRLYGVSGFDLRSYAVASVLLGGVTILASWVPARTAARLEPSGALREE
jgi:predicted permease